jgi:hypothetical protein
MSAEHQNSPHRWQALDFTKCKNQVKLLDLYGDGHGVRDGVIDWLRRRGSRKGGRSRARGGVGFPPTTRWQAHAALEETGELEDVGVTGFGGDLANREGGLTQ